MHCPIDNCDKHTPADKVMCGRHWKTVSRGTQREVYREWARRLRGDDGAREAHTAAKDRAIAEANAAEAQRTAVQR